MFWFFKPFNMIIFLYFLKRWPRLLVFQSIHGLLFSLFPNFSPNCNRIYIVATGATGGIPVEFATRNVSIQITLPAQQGVPDAQPRSITIQVPATALQGDVFNLFLILDYLFVTNL
jgi:hypothetical protein